jgi:nitroreductase
VKVSANEKYVRKILHIIWVDFVNRALIEAGVYKYVSKEYKIIQTIGKDTREELSAAALGQSMLRGAPVTVVYCAVFSRITGRYGERGRERYVFMELGQQRTFICKQKLCGTCTIGAFTDSRVSKLLQLPAEEEPLCLMPVGYFASHN